MKGGILGLRSTKVALVLVTLICTTFVIWGWDKTPFIVLLIPENQFFKVSPVIVAFRVQLIDKSRSYTKQYDQYQQMMLQRHQQQQLHHQAQTFHIRVW